MFADIFKNIDSPCVGNFKTGSSYDLMRIACQIEAGQPVVHLLKGVWKEIKRRRSRNTNAEQTETDTSGDVIGNTDDANEEIQPVVDHQMGFSEHKYSLRIAAKFINCDMKKTSSILFFGPHD